MKQPHSQGYIALTTVIILSFVMTSIVVAMSKEMLSFETFVNYRRENIRTRGVLLSCISVVQEKVAEENMDTPSILYVVLQEGYQCNIEIVNTQPFVAARVRVGGRSVLARIDPIHATVVSLTHDLL